MGATFLAGVWAWPQISAGHATAEKLMKDYVIQWCKHIENTNEFAHPIDLFWRLEPDMIPMAKRVCINATMPRMAALVAASPIDAALHDAFGNAAGIDVYHGYTGCLGTNHRNELKYSYEV
ncbi:MAG: hypothetical protein JKY95_11935 [Planctomycetaceae bacterium]|nr:hypothetical protein [Planctomycetaceae bacterium]